MVQPTSSLPFFVMLHYAGEEQWETDCSVDMHSALFSLRVKLPPRLAFGELTPGQPAELGVISRYLDRIAVRGNGHPGNLCHRDDLLDVVFRCPPTIEMTADLCHRLLKVLISKLSQLS